jgi:Rad51
LATPRLSQISESLTSTLTTNPPDVPEEDVNAALISLSCHGDRILYYHCADLESQEHIVTYQLHVLLSRHRIGLIILDSVTANYRAEFDLAPTLSQKSQSQAVQMVQRSKDLRKLAGILKDLAIQWNVAVVVVNQVTDTFTRSLSQGLNSTPEEDLLSLNYQARWFDGLIDEYGEESTKKPALGLVWSNLITSRIMLVRDNDGRSRIKVVFSPFARQGSLLYEISSEAGIHAITRDSKRTKVTKVVEDEGIQEDTPRDDAGASDIDLKAYDMEFSDFDVEDVLSGRPNI